MLLYLLVRGPTNGFAMSWTNAFEANITPTCIICKVWMQDLKFHSSFTPKSDTLSLLRKYGWSRESRKFQMKITKRTPPYFPPRAPCVSWVETTIDLPNWLKYQKAFQTFKFSTNFLNNFKVGLPLFWWQGGCCCCALGKLHHVAFACFWHHRGCALRIGWTYFFLVTIKSVAVLAVAPWYLFWASYWKPESPLLWSCCHVDAEFGRGIRVWLALNICIWS